MLRTGPHSPAEVREAFVAACREATESARRFGAALRALHAEHRAWLRSLPYEQFRKARLA